MAVEMYSCGDNSKRLGREGSSKLAKASDIPENLKFVSSGWKYSVLLTSDNHFYFFGDTDKNVVGNDVSSAQTTSFIR